MDFNQILCPVDFSEPSAAALRTAGMLTRTLQAGLTVLHAQRWELPPYFTVAQSNTLKSHLRRSKKAARKYLEEFVNQRLPAELPRSYALVEEEPVAAILRHARELPADLIVMGTHGRTGWSKLRLGSVMQDVLRQSGQPVVAVGPAISGERAKLSLHHVLCPVAFDALSQATIELAASLALKAGATLTLLHVKEPGSGSDGSMKQSQNRLCEWAASAVRIGANQCSVREVVRAGSTVESIARQAAEVHADLLVVGAKPHHSLGWAVFGTTTESLIRNSARPVLVVTASATGTQRAAATANRKG